METLLKKRYYLIDTLRGFSLISMIIYHLAWDCVYIYGLDWAFYHSNGAYIWQQSICWTFIFLSGFCWHFGRNKLKNGVLVFGSGALVTAVTLIFMPKQAIIFGVLTLIGSSILLLIPLHKLLQKVSPYIGAVTSFGLFLLFRNVNDGFLGFESFNLITLPEILYKNYLTTFLGFPFESFYSTDYFSLIPWFFLFVTGYFMHYIIMNCNFKNVLTYKVIPPLSFVGRHTLIIYLLHQPIIYGFLYLIL